MHASKNINAHKIRIYHLKKRKENAPQACLLRSQFGGDMLQGAGHGPPTPETFSLEFPLSNVTLT